MPKKIKCHGDYNSLFEKYASKQNEIENRANDFLKLKNAEDKTVLSELSFCICAANSSAKAAWLAQQELKGSGLLLNGDAKEISAILLKSGVRFHNNKAKYLVEARKKLFSGGKFSDYAAKFENEFELRNALARDVLGLGMKEAGHFLRNIGRGERIAILDRHILKNLLKYMAIKEIPASLTKKKYLEIEGKMNEFSDKTKIPMVHLDLLFWSEQTGRIFK
jgi:N-glycosylase/DNA lyase